jgi:predicted metallo-beta-lactamase superfamily hydrolase
MPILDHHLKCYSAGLEWLDTLSAETGKKLYCAADFMHQACRLLEAERIGILSNELYFLVVGQGKV